MLKYFKCNYISLYVNSVSETNLMTVHFCWDNMVFFKAQILIFWITTLIMIIWTYLITLMNVVRHLRKLKNSVFIITYQKVWFRLLTSIDINKYFNGFGYCIQWCSHYTIKNSWRLLVYCYRLYNIKYNISIRIS